MTYPPANCGPARDLLTVDTIGYCTYNDMGGSSIYAMQSLCYIEARCGSMLPICKRSALISLAKTGCRDGPASRRTGLTLLIAISKGALFCRNEPDLP